MPIRARVPGESEDEYQRYVKLSHGVEARDAARARGIDTSGQYWDGRQFKDADAGPMKFIGEHPGVGLALALAPAAPFALGGLFGGGGAAAATGASTAGAGAGTSAVGGGMLGGFKLGDLIKGGTDLTSMLLGNLANNKSANVNATSAADALAFATRQYDEQNALENQRYAATEARRVPFRAAANDSLIALKQLLGLGR